MIALDTDDLQYISEDLSAVIVIIDIVSSSPSYGKEDQ